MKHDIIYDPCMFCGAFGGYVVQCSGCDDDTFHTSTSTSTSTSTFKRCSAVFHPLCAWFQGLHVRTTVTDPTFQGQNRNGLYPSGLSFEFHCDDHCPPNVRGTEITEQMTLRRKYKINEEDLDQIPGKNRKKKKKRVAPGVRENVPTGRSAGSGPKVKELNRDVYDQSTCALCLAPMEPIFPHSRDKPVVPTTSEVAAAAALQTLQNITAANSIKNAPVVPTSASASSNVLVSHVPFIVIDDDVDRHTMKDDEALVQNNQNAIITFGLSSSTLNSITAMTAAGSEEEAHPVCDVLKLPSTMTQTDIPPTHSFYHRLVCVDCGINVHLGCHCETGGISILSSGNLEGK